MRIYSKPYSIEDYLQEFEGDEKKQGEIKAQFLSRVKLPETFVKDGMIVAVIEQPWYKDGMVWLNIAAFDNESKTPLKVDNPFIFRNPPVKIPRLEVVDGKECTVYVEDLRAVLMQCVYDAVKYLNPQWQP